MDDQFGRQAALADTAHFVGVPDVVAGSVQLEPLGALRPVILMTSWQKECLTYECSRKCNHAAQAGALFREADSR